MKKKLMAAISAMVMIITFGFVGGTANAAIPTSYGKIMPTCSQRLVAGTGNNKYGVFENFLRCDGRNYNATGTRVVAVERCVVPLASLFHTSWCPRWATNPYKVVNLPKTYGARTSLNSRILVKLQPGRYQYRVATSNRTSSSNLVPTVSHHRWVVPGPKAQGQWTNKPWQG